MSDCQLDHHDAAVRVASLANDLLGQATGAKMEDFQRQAAALAAIAQVHATLAAGGYACAPEPPLAAEVDRLDRRRADAER